jgi:predicted Zn-dependent protease with MMP-like domain
VSSGADQQQRDGAARRRGRDRHGRGLRGPLAPAHVPVSRTRAEQFDDAVLDALEHLERRWAAELAGVQLVVEDVPPVAAADPGSDPVLFGEVALGRVIPAARRRPARLVLYRRPIEARVADTDGLEDLALMVLVDLVADLLGLTPEQVDPDIDDH